MGAKEARAQLRDKYAKDAKNARDMADLARISGFPNVEMNLTNIADKNATYSQNATVTPRIKPNRPKR